MKKLTNTKYKLHPILNGFVIVATIITTIIVVLWIYEPTRKLYILSKDLESDNLEAREKSISYIKKELNKSSSISLKDNKIFKYLSEP